MGAVATTRDVEGGLEVVKWHTGHWAVRLHGAENPLAYAFILPRRRNAVAMRRLLLEVWPDWAAMPRGGDGRLDPPPDVKRAVFRLADLAEDETRRRLRGECLLCGYDPRSPHGCVCHRPHREGEPRRWAARDMEWAR